jgi:hypothetical protein
VVYAGLGNAVAAAKAIRDHIAASPAARAAAEASVARAIALREGLR